MPTLDELAAQVAALDAKVERVLKGLAQLGRHLGAFPGDSRAASSSSTPTFVQPAPDALLDAADGDPTVRFDVKKGWTSEGQESLKGRALSTCPAKFLDLYAAQLEWSSRNPEKAKFRDENLRTAALARGWAARLRAQDPPADSSAPGDEDLT